VHKKTADHSSEWKVRFSAAAWTCWALLLCLVHEILRYLL